MLHELMKHNQGTQVIGISPEVGIEHYFCLPSEAC
jgi:hypothetical protein